MGSGRAGLRRHLSRLFVPINQQLRPADGLHGLHGLHGLAVAAFSAFRDYQQSTLNYQLSPAARLPETG
jgi:hypothetical protein